MSSEENLFFSVLRRKAQGGFKYTIKIYSWLLSCFTARGSGTGFSRVSPVKVKARKSFLYTEKFFCIEIKEQILSHKF